MIEQSKVNSKLTGLQETKVGQTALQNATDPPTAKEQDQRVKMKKAACEGVFV